MSTYIEQRPAHSLLVESDLIEMCQPCVFHTNFPHYSASVEALLDSTCMRH